MRAATCFSGIGAPECAMPEWDWRWSADIEPFPNAVRAERFPGITNLGDVLAEDFLSTATEMGPLDVLIGGPPCQDFSVAGLREGLNGARGNLTLRWVQIIHALRPRWAVTENVPGWLSVNGGQAFGAFLAGLVGLDTALVPPRECGGQWTSAGMVDGPEGRAAWRILDAQYFGLAQRRQRVFVVFCFGDRGDPAAVLFEPASLRGDPAPRREAGERAAPTLAARTRGGGGLGTDAEVNGALVAGTLNASFGSKLGLDNQHVNSGCPLFVPVAFGWQNSPSQGDSVSTHHTPTLDKSKTPAVAFDINQIANPIHSPRLTPGAPCGTLGSQNRHGVAFAAAVRRLTPRECERLQGFPDDFTLIPYRNGMAADGPRYRALGNSMAVPVVSWIGRRIANVDAQMRAATEEVA